MTDHLKKIEQVKARIRLLLKDELKDDQDPYAIAITAMADLMMEILVWGCGKEKREANALCASLFTIDINTSEQARKH